MTHVNNFEYSRIAEIQSQIRHLTAEYHDLTKDRATRHRRPEFKMPAGASVEKLTCSHPHKSKDHQPITESHERSMPGCP